jgi:hypothetical protein
VLKGEKKRKKEQSSRWVVICWPIQATLGPLCHICPRHHEARHPAASQQVSFFSHLAASRITWSSASLMSSMWSSSNMTPPAQRRPQCGALEAWPPMVRPHELGGASAARRWQQISGMTDLPAPRVCLPPKARRKVSAERLIARRRAPCSAFFSRLKNVKFKTCHQTVPATKNRRMQTSWRLSSPQKFVKRQWT